jgi:hypothetical protein
MTEYLELALAVIAVIVAFYKFCQWKKQQAAIAREYGQELRRQFLPAGMINADNPQDRQRAKEQKERQDELRWWRWW